MGFARGRMPSALLAYSPPRCNASLTSKIGPATRTNPACRTRCLGQWHRRVRSSKGGTHEAKRMVAAVDSRDDVVCRRVPRREHRAAEEARDVDPLGPEPRLQQVVRGQGKEFAKSGYEVEVVTIPYQGYEAKYLAGFMASGSAPDMFMGMTHQWCGQYDFCDRMPADLAKMTRRTCPSTCSTSASGRARALRDSDRARQLPADVHQRRHVQEGGSQSGRSAQELRQMAGRPEEADDCRRQGRRADAGGLRHPQQGRSGGTTGTSSSRLPMHGVPGCSARDGQGQRLCQSARRWWPR